MIQCKMLLLTQWLQKKWPISNLCSGQIKKITSDLIFILCLADKSFSSVCPAGRPSVRRAIHSSLASANRYNNNCSSYSVHICIWRISRWNSNMGDLNLFLQIIQVCLIPYRYIKHRFKKTLLLQCPSLHHRCIWWISRSSWDRSRSSDITWCNFMYSWYRHKKSITFSIVYQALFARFISIRQQRNIQLLSVFQYELSPVQHSLVDEFGYLLGGGLG